MQPHYILMADLLHYLDLGMQVFEIEITSEDALVYYLYRNWLTSLCDLAAVDRSVAALAEEPLEVELVFLDSLLGLHAGNG